MKSLFRVVYTISHIMFLQYLFMYCNQYYKTFYSVGRFLQRLNYEINQEESRDMEKLPGIAKTLPSNSPTINILNAN